MNVKRLATIVFARK